MTQADICLMDRLKNATRERHLRMEALPFVTALVDGNLPLQSYVGQLRALSVIHSTLEYELGRLSLPGVYSLLLSRPSRLTHLRRDMGNLDLHCLPDCLQAMEAARLMAEKIRLYAISEHQGLLGIVYVLEGTTFGNAVHLPDVVRNFGGSVSGCTHYYAGYGDKTESYWQIFSSVMNSMGIDQAFCQRLTDVALESFDLLEQLYASLYPIGSGEWGFTAATLNPEAGQHPVPSDTAEIKAAVSSARKCREEFPYFNERYQERGRSFAKSDAAWLVTLAEMSLPQLLGQVEWLGRVLVNRGMPRITLERQLELLYEELKSAQPGRLDDWQGLLEAARHLRLQRERHLPDHKFNDLARRFSEATDNEQQGRFANTGKLIVSAVCDEAEGMEEAVISLCSWLCDPERFSSDWLSAVEHTLEQTRSALEMK